MLSGGETLVSSPPVFSHDAKHLLICRGSKISVFSTSSAMLVAELVGHTGLVTSVVVVPLKFVNSCWTSSVDGSICKWDFLSAELVTKVSVGVPVYSMVIPHIASIPVASGKKAPNLYAVVSVENTNAPNKLLSGQIQVYNLTSSCRVGGLLAETHKPEPITVSKSGEYFGITNKRKLHIWWIPSVTSKFDEIKKITLHHTKNFSAFAFHPNQRMVAGGDATGRILTWIGFGRRKFSGSPKADKVMNLGDEDRPGVRDNDDADSCSTRHWHQGKVRFLLFSSDGSYLYSGGDEGVIVVWQLETGKKKYKPRLGSPLLYFAESPDPSLSCVSCADNRVLILKMPTFEITKSIGGIKPPFLVNDETKGFYKQLSYDGIAGLLALTTEDYCIQFFSLFDDLEVSKVQVCERNYQPADDITVYVALVALSSNGFLMGTVDVRLAEEELGRLVSLKFWIRGSRAGEYLLSTVIYEPHCDEEISALAFRPNHQMAVTASFGGEFKVWVLDSCIETIDQATRKTGWRCQSVGSYKGKPMTSAAFSADGSVLAIAAESVVTLWDPDRNTLVAVTADTHSPIKTLSFIGTSDKLALITQGSSPELIVWNTSKLTLHWSYKFVAEAVSGTDDGSRFAVLVLTNSTNENSDGIILLFDIENPVPVASWIVKKAKGGRIAFLPSNSLLGNEVTIEENAALLTYVNSNHQYIVFDPLSTQDDQVSSNRNKQISEQEAGAASFGYASLYGNLPNFNPKNLQISEIPFVPSDRPWETIFSGSSHVLPPLTKLCSTFLASLLEKRPTVDP